MFGIGKLCASEFFENVHSGENASPNPRGQILILRPGHGNRPDDRVHQAIHDHSNKYDQVADASVPLADFQVGPYQMPDSTEEVAKKQPAVTEEQLQEKLRMRRQESFLRKAAVLDSIGKYDDGDENILVESSRTKKKQGRPSALVDRRMDASEESFVWTRSKDCLDEE